jgi:hypothetical protein
MLKRGRVKLMVLDNLSLNALLAQGDIQPDEVQLLFDYMHSDSYIAFSLQTDDALVHRWQHELERMKGDGSFAYKAVGTIPCSDNFDAIRLSRRIYFVEPTEIEVLLIPEPGNIDRKLAVAVTLDSKLLGYVPAKEASEMHKYLLANSGGVRANAKIYLGSRPEYNGLMLDFSKPLRLESRRK